ncbi:RidA family protein [Virgibacillus kekensis]|uniref:RidA family protein n=1 Tax=Virgibacillus kekensis TaxID=202261 RepID=A0ABV9DHR6_9BACI
MKQLIETLNAPKPTGPYSQGVKAGGFIFVSGQDGVHPDGSTAGESIGAQAAASLDNIKNILAEKGAGLSDLVYVTCHLNDLTEANVKAFNEVYAGYFADVEVKPARITVGSQLMETDVEITAIACVD